MSENVNTPAPDGAAQAKPSPDAAPSMNVALAGDQYTVVAPDKASETFWNAAASGDWEEATINYLERRLTKETTVLDIGGWIGPVALMASKRAKNVVSIEPDPVAFAQLSRNVELNCTNVEARNLAVGAEKGTLTLQSRSFGNSMTSAVGVVGDDVVTVKTIPLSDLSTIAPSAEPLFVKIDIEGYEYEIMDAIHSLVSRPQASLLLSLHPRNLYRSLRPKMSGFAARRETYARTIRFLKLLRQSGDISLLESASFIPVEALAFRCVFLRRNLKNFTMSFVSHG